MKVTPPAKVAIPAVTLPTEEIVAPVPTLILVPSKVKFASPFNVLAVPEPVIILLSAFLFIVVPVTVDQDTEPDAPPEVNT